MKTVNFNLRTLQAKNETSILLVIHYRGMRLRLSTKERVLVSQWNREKQRIYQRIETEEAKRVNQRLDALENMVLRYLNALKEGSDAPTSADVKKHIGKCIDQAKNTEHTDFFWKLFDAFVVYKEKTTQSHQDYDNALRKHLQTTEQLSGIPLTFEALQYQEQGFVEHMRNYLLYKAINQKGTQGLQVNTIWKQFKNLKAFLNWCVDHTYISKFSTKHMHIQTEVIHHVYLTEKELSALEKLELNEDKKIVRDLFLVSCETGMRFSDVSQLGANMRQQGLFEIYPKKTRDKRVSNRILIPFSSRVKRILETYENGDLPHYSYSKIHTFNKLLKEICQQAEIHESITYYRKIQNKSASVERKKYELISSHTGRRTFCTLKFLAGMPSHVIMKFSGHSSEQNFLRYLRLDAEITAKTYKSFFD
jgi:integrase